LLFEILVVAASAPEENSGTSFRTYDASTHVSTKVERGDLAASADRPFIGESLSLLTVVTTALSAAALFILSYEIGLFPGGFFEGAAIGPMPLWVVCLALILLLVAVCVGTVLMIVEERRHG